MSTHGDQVNDPPAEQSTAQLEDQSFQTGVAEESTNAQLLAALKANYQESIKEIRKSQADAFDFLSKFMASQRESGIPIIPSTPTFVVNQAGNSMTSPRVETVVDGEVDTTIGVPTSPTRNVVFEDPVESTPAPSRPSILRGRQSIQPAFNPFYNREHENGSRDNPIPPWEARKQRTLKEASRILDEPPHMASPNIGPRRTTPSSQRPSLPLVANQGVPPLVATVEEFPDDGYSSDQESMRSGTQNYAADQAICESGRPTVSYKSSKITVKTPDSFDGVDRSKLWDFLDELDNYFRSDPNYDLQHPRGGYNRITMAMACVTGQVRQWCRDMKTRGVKHNFDSDWFVFRNSLIVSWQDIDAASRAQLKLDALQQRREPGYAIEYTSEFNYLARQGDLSENSSVHAYRKGLNPACKRALVNFDGDSTSLEAVQEFVYRHDTRMLTAKIEEETEAKLVKNRSTTNNKPTVNSNPVKPVAANGQRYQKPLPNTPGNKQPVPAHIQCHDCGENHYVRDCPNPKNNDKARINAVKTYCVTACCTDDLCNRQALMETESVDSDIGSMAEIETVPENASAV